MGNILNCCEKKTKRKIKESRIKEEKKHIFSFQINGYKKDKDQAGQDAFDVITTELGHNVKYFGVYDGHGLKGREAADLAKNEINSALKSDRKKLSKFKEKKEADKYFKKLFINIQNKFKKNSEYDNSGTCVIATLLVDNHCFCINLGDSRCVIGSKQGSQKIAYQLSIDQKANKEEEKKRIESSGGVVSHDRNGAIGPYRVYAKNEDGPGLAVSRSLGDLIGHQIGVSAEPEISYREIEPEDRFIVIGSDGVWDVMNSAEVIGLVFEKSYGDSSLNKEKSAEFVVNESRNRWEILNIYKTKIHTEKTQSKDQSGKGVIHTPFFSIDDITSVICYFHISEH